MKSFIVLLLVAAVVAEPPRYRLFRYRVPRADAEEIGGERESEKGDAPYPSSGYKPSKEFKLPERQEFMPPSTSYGVPDDSYKAPFNTFTAPQVEYGVPRSNFDENRDEGREGRKMEGKTESEERPHEETSEKRQEKPEREGEGSEHRENEDRKEDMKGERKEERKQKENLEEGSDYSSRSEGSYYVLLPGPQLQRVQYQTLNDAYNMAYTAKLQYRNEERAPIYVYTSVPATYQTAAYQALQYQALPYQASPYQSSAYGAPVYQAPAAYQQPTAAFSAYKVIEW